MVSASDSSMEGVGFEYHLGECTHFVEVNSEMLPVDNQSLWASKLSQKSNVPKTCSVLNIRIDCDADQVSSTFIN